MNEREYLIKAQEAEAVANAAERVAEQEGWENIAAGCRRLAREKAALRQMQATGDSSEG
jgi:hypothetical protein